MLLAAMPLSMALTSDSENSGTDNMAETMLNTINSTTCSNESNKKNNDLFIVSSANNNYSNLAYLEPECQKAPKRFLDASHIIITYQICAHFIYCTSCLIFYAAVSYGPFSATTDFWSVGLCNIAQYCNFVDSRFVS